MDFTAFSQLLIVSSAVALIVQWLTGINRRIGHWASVLIAMAISVFGAVVYMVLQNYGLWASFVQVLAGASTIYAIIIRGLEKPSNQA